MSARRRARHSGVARRLVWLWLLVGWLPVWALFVALMLSAHANVTLAQAVVVALRMSVAGAVLGLLVQRLTERVPWPQPFALRFAALHLGAAVLFAVAWVLLNSVVESVRMRQAVIVVGGAGLGSFLVMGVWLYLIIAGVSYATRATERAALAEAAAARAQLAALRGQLHPHFLFNALHTVVQLIPQQPKLAAQSAEGLAGLLRVTLEEERDLVTLGEEWAVVERYLELERIRFGERLRVEARIAPGALAARVPSFAVQTLVENAVRHGAAPRVEPTTVVVEAAASADGGLAVTVRDDGAGAAPDAVANGAGTGLARLRERLEVLYGSEASLEVTTAPGAGFTATLRLPAERE